MKNEQFMEFDVDAQLKQIELFTLEQRKEIDLLLEKGVSTYYPDEDENASSVMLSCADKINEEVSGMIGSLSSQLDNEMEKINEQLQSLLPNEVK